MAPLAPCLPAAIPEKALAVLEHCAAGVASPEQLAAPVLLLAEDGYVNFEDAFYNGVLLRLAMAPHQRPAELTATLVALAAAASTRLDFGGSGGGGGEAAVAERSVRWLLEVQGGAGRDARDTGVRWRLCTMLRGFLLAARAPAAAPVPQKLQARVDLALLARVRDRSADVRLAAVQAVALQSMRASGMEPVVVERALGDCDAQVRAAAVQALFAGGCDVPELVLHRSRMDAAPRVRRALLGAILDRMEDATKEWDPEWRDAMLLGLGDHCRAVRLAAADVLLAAAGRGWLPELFQDPELVGDTALPLAAAFADLTRQDPDLKALRKFLAPGPALAALAQESSPQRAVFARVAFSTAAMLGAAAPLGGGGVVELARRALRRGDSFELQQLLLVLLTGELPPETAGRAKLVQVASEALVFAPVQDVAEELLKLGSFPAMLLGSQLKPAPDTMTLAMLVLRRVASEDGQRLATGLPRSCLEAEARFSRMASNVVKALLRKLADLEEGAGQQRPSTGAEPAGAPGPGYDELLTRTVSAASAWLSLSRAPLARDAAQRQLLEDVLRPGVKSSELGHSGQVAAMRGIALYAAKTAEQAAAHWKFFVGLLEANLLHLYAPWSLASGQGLPLCAVARLVEIALLFLTDALLLYRQELAKGTTDQVFMAIAKVLAALDHAASKNELNPFFRSLRSVACDRACTLLVMGRPDTCTAAVRWVLGHLLADVCGVGAPQLPPAETAEAPLDPHGYASLVPHCMKARDAEPAEDKTAACSHHAVLCSRLLRFFGMLPSLSPAHAEMVAIAAEAFFGARLWTLAPAREVASSRVCPVVRAARLTCRHLGRCPALQLRVVRTVGAALLTAPANHEVMLSDALVAACLASANGGPPLAWAAGGPAGGRGAGAGAAAALGEALAALLAAWVPQSTAQLVKGFVSELHAHAAADDGGWSWAQSALDAAADLRHDLASLGLSSSFGAGFDPSLGAVEEELLIKTPAKVKRGAAAVAESSTLTAVPAPKRPKLEELAWQLVDCTTGACTTIAMDGEVIIGRMSKCDVVVQSAAASGRHCSITCTRLGLQLEDLSTTNGTFVNDRRVLPGASVTAQVGDVIAIAARTGQRFKVQRGAAASQPGTHCDVVVVEEQPAISPQKEPRPAPLAAPGGGGGAPPVAAAAKRRRLRAKTSNPPWDVGYAKKMRHDAAAPAAAPIAAVEALDERVGEPKQEADVEEPQQEADLEERVALAVLSAAMDGTATAPRLVHLSSGEVKQLPKDGVFTVGRRYDCDLVVEEPNVSSRHCVLYCTGGRVEVEDVSSNGTLINETRIPKGFALPQHVALMEGDHLTLAHSGGASFLFVPPGAGGA